MIQPGVSVGGNPWVDETSNLARALMARAGADPGPLRLVHLRRKPGKGAVVRLEPELEVRSRRRDPDAASPVWLSLEERTLGGALPRPLAGLLRDQPVMGAWPGGLSAEPVGISLHGFGVDAALPALGDACAPEPGGAIWCGLEQAARRRLGDAVQLIAVIAVPVRYKPGSRCVLRYTLAVAGGETVTVFGKLFAEPMLAVAVDAITRRLHAEQAESAEPPVVPRPLGTVESAGLALSAAGGEGDGITGPLRSGIRVLLPRRRGDAVGLGLPTASLVAAAEAIARLHSSSISLREGLGVVRSGARAADRARERAALLCGFAPALAPRLTAAADGLAARLAAAVCEAPVPSHGGFKPSQLVYSAADRVVLTDLDGICLADPALDLGYFLAYLRPLTVWTERTGTETWFAFAAATFLDAYARGMRGLGAPPHLVAASLRRVPLYEAALLLKIAARRPQRLNAPRPAELAAMLEEIGLCLSAASRAA